MYSKLLPHSHAQFWIAELMYSGPLSHRMTCGFPRQENRGADALLPANVGHRKARLDPFDRIHDLAVGEF
jgi:hypothetical protein